MCGFAGYWSFGRTTVADNEALLHRMGDVIITRGPDSSGIFFDAADAIGFTHRRLAIVDLSEAGHQPMRSKSGRYVIAFNGEIYNHNELRRELGQTVAVSWSGHSDTETLLVAIERWGLKLTLQKAKGMFALSLWDSQRKELYLARDRFGEKPLYYCLNQGSLIFGSQLSSLREHPEFSAEIERDSIALLLRHNYIPAPYSIYKGVFKLLPGTIVSFRSDAGSTYEEYWSARDVILNALANQSEGDVTAQLDEIEKCLSKAVSGQMLADVPLGAFLSGGIDSSLIVALMQKQSDKPVKTFSIGFDDERFNEAKFAKEVATHLGTEHTELYVTARDALAVIPELPAIFDEPFSDSSQIPTYLVSKIAKQHVTVSLSGDAGDELFCGYNRYMLTANTWGKLNRLPVFLRKVLSRLLLLVPVNAWDFIGRILPKRYTLRNLGDKLHKAAAVITSKDINELYLRLVSHWQSPQEVVLGSKEPLTALTDPERRIVVDDPILQMMALDTVTYLPDDILVKVDRSAMAVSLETRVPFLDHNVFELAWKMPLSIKLKSGQSKWCLRQILYKYVPKELIERPKMGFAVPLDSWLRGPLLEWAENLLNHERLVSEGFFDANIISSMWQEHKSGKRNWQYQLWDILMFQAWFEKYHK